MIMKSKNANNHMHALVRQSGIKTKQHNIGFATKWGVALLEVLNHHQKWGNHTTWKTPSKRGFPRKNRPGNITKRRNLRHWNVEMWTVERRWAVVTFLNRLVKGRTQLWKSFKARCKWRWNHPNVETSLREIKPFIGVEVVCASFLTGGEANTQWDLNRSDQCRKKPEDKSYSEKHPLLFSCNWVTRGLKAFSTTQPKHNTPPVFSF